MAKPPVEIETLRALLRIRYPDMTDLRPIVEGEESRAFAFDASSGRYVVRVNGSGLAFAKDRFAHARFDGQALPVPEVLLIAPYGAEAWLCVSQRLDGVTLQALPPGGAFAYGAVVGRVLDAMAQLIPGNSWGAGPFDTVGRGTHATWPAYIAAIAGSDWQAFTGARRDETRRLAATVEAMARDLPDWRGLVHGDFGSNNVLVADGRIVGVIDWSEAMIGDPLYDLANLLFWRPWLDCMEQQCRYFERHEPWRLAPTGRLACYQLHIGLKLLCDALAESDERMVEWSLARCRAIAGNA